MQVTASGNQNKESTDAYNKKKQSVCAQDMQLREMSLTADLQTLAQLTHTMPCTPATTESHFINENKSPTTTTTLNANSYNTH